MPLLGDIHGNADKLDLGCVGVHDLGAGAHPVLVILAVILTALANGVVSPMLMSWMGDLTRRGGRGPLVGAYQTMGDLGSGLAPALVYPLLDSWGVRPVYAASAALLALTVPLILASRRWAGSANRHVAAATPQPVACEPADPRGG